jgi:ketosteroid isomerase-like protein
MTPQQVAETYLELFTAGRYAEMGELFAEDGLWRRPPPAPEVRGRDLIVAGYASPEQARACRDLRMTANRYLVDGSTVVAEFVFHTPTSELVVLDVFDVDIDGRIACMTAYARPSS